MRKIIKSWPCVLVLALVMNEGRLAAWTCDGFDTAMFAAAVGGCVVVCPNSIVTNVPPGQTDLVVYFALVNFGCDCTSIFFSPAPGSAFPIGTTTVTAYGVDSFQVTNTCTFTITVHGVPSACSIVCPADVVTNVPDGETGIVVNYPSPTLSGDCVGASGDCVPASGSTFPLGVTTVTCFSVDSSNNTNADAFTITVTSSSIVSVINTNDNGAGSLRQAILDANANAGLDTIQFTIPGVGVHTITPASALPTLDDSVVIDGYTQPGTSANTLTNGNNASLLIELTGTGAGLTITTSNSTVAGLVINLGNGIVLSGVAATNNVIEGNFIGTDASGRFARPNGNNGILIVGPAAGNRIGGTTPAARNVISANFANGIFFGGGATGNQIQGNFIGTDATGTNALGNGTLGIGIFDAANNLVGGDTPSAGNVIAANTVDGIVCSGIDATTTTGNIVQGNWIGTDRTGTRALGNGNNGVLIVVTPDTTIADNVIAHNASSGVLIEVSSAIRNAILGNAIFANTAGGIDLNPDGVTPNDAGDLDAGPNNLQNFPVLSSAVRAGANTLIAGSLNSAASTMFRIEFFANSQCDPNGFGEGETFLGFTNVTTDVAGNATFNVSFPVALALGTAVTATATDSAGNTSEFSQCVPLSQLAPHDLAVIKLKVPKKIALSATTTSKVGKFSVSIQNRGPQTETVPDLATLNELVTVEVETLGTNCASFVATFVPPKKSFPISIAPNKKLNLSFTANFNCYNDPAATTKTAAHSDYRTTAVIDLGALGEVDTASSNDACPRPPSGSDPGCGNKVSNGTLGADVFTDVIQK